MTALSLQITLPKLGDGVIYRRIPYYAVKLKVWLKGGSLRDCLPV
jgi:hypothetical protein